MTEAQRQDQSSQFSRDYKDQQCFLLSCPWLSSFSPSSAFLQQKLWFLNFRYFFHILSIKVKKKKNQNRSLLLLSSVFLHGDRCYIACKLASTWMCSQGCASTAWHFRLSPFSVAIVSYNPVPLLRSQTPCLPSFYPCFLFVPWYSYGPLSPVLPLPSSPWRHTGTSPQVQSLRLPPDAQPSSASRSAFSAHRLPHHLSSVLGKMHWWWF